MPRGSDAGALVAVPRVERAGAADAAALAALAAEALPDPWSQRGFELEIESPDARVWIVRGPAPALVGYLAAQHVLDEIHVWSLAVAAASRRRGVGRLLIEHALAHGGRARIAHLEVRAADAGARAFYERLRFEAVGRRPGFYAGGADAISMSRVVQREA